MPEGTSKAEALLGWERDILALIDDLRDPDPCHYDHHGYCQAHGWMTTTPRCPHARAADLLNARGYGPADDTTEE
jgi:hypothetical protein